MHNTNPRIKSRHIHRKIGSIGSIAKNVLQFKQFKCSQCPKWFTSKLPLKVHQHLHEKNSKRQCTICGRCYSTTGLLIEHLIRRFPEESNFECPMPECGKFFFYRCNFKQHVRTHGGYKCEFTECVAQNKQFSSRLNLEYHVKKHLNILPYKCDVCPNKSFIYKTSLKVHKNSQGHAKFLQKKQLDTPKL